MIGRTKVAALLAVGLALALPERGQADPLRFELPKGWTFERKQNRYQVEYSFERDTNAYVERKLAEEFGLVDLLPLYHPVDPITAEERAALESPMGNGIASVRVVVGRPPAMDMFNTSIRAKWTSVGDVWDYVNTWEKSNDDYTEIAFNDWDGVAYTTRIFPSRIYQLVYAPGKRMFVRVRPARTLHWDEVTAILDSLEQSPHRI